MVAFSGQSRPSHCPLAVIPLRESTTSGSLNVNGVKADFQGTGRGRHWDIDVTTFLHADMTSLEVIETAAMCVATFGISWRCIVAVAFKGPLIHMTAPNCAGVFACILTTSCKPKTGSRNEFANSLLYIVKSWDINGFARYEI